MTPTGAPEFPVSAVRECRFRVHRSARTAANDLWGQDRSPWGTKGLLTDLACNLVAVGACRGARIAVSGHDRLPPDSAFA
jgi:hypothetical protein